MLPEIVTTHEELFEVWRLTHELYVNEGYCDPNPNGLLAHHRELDLVADGSLNPITTVFVVRGRHGLLGTCSITLDSTFGLHCDDTYPYWCDRIRDECRTMGWLLACVWRIEARPEAKPWVIGSLIGSIVAKGRELKIGVALCTFHPRHRSFYERFLNMRVIAEAECEMGLKNAPSILMRWDREGGFDAWEHLGARFWPE